MAVAFMGSMGEPARVMADLEVPGDAPPLRFERFFEAEHERLLRALFVLTGDAHEAEELAQEAFLALWQRWDRVRTLEDPTGYLYRTAMNRFRSRVRRITRAAVRVMGHPAPADAFAAADERDALARALSSLTPRQRAAIVLTDLLGYGSEDAGRILGVKDVTVRVLASQARAALRQNMEVLDE
jgi:RNA polymerase sigma factor (sigma-70 family)